MRYYLEFTGVLRYIRRLKTKGIRLDLIVVALCVYRLHTFNSMNACAEWLENSADWGRHSAQSEGQLSNGIRHQSPQLQTVDTRVQ